MSQALMITLAVIFATALSVTIAMICISYLEKNPTTYTATQTVPQRSTESDTVITTRYPIASSNAPLYSDTLGTSESLSESPIPEPETPLGNGLAFASNGNGTCTLIGIGTCTDVCVTIPEYSPAGDRVTSIAPRAFYACSFLTAVQIPAGVTLIGDQAFAACNNLVYISVNDTNPYYCDIDGILYTADLYTLHLYPPMRAGSNASISSVTAEIMEMAFYNCAYLTHIYYEGSAEQWDSIDIGPRNHSLTAASKTFEGGKGA